MDGLKKPFAASLNSTAIQRAADAMQTLGRALPCHVVAVEDQIVTVAFDLDSTPYVLPNVTMPIATSQYDWLPIQLGDLGMTVPADVYMGGVSGLGGGTATLTDPGNMSALVFLPVANSGWAQLDPGKRIIQGPTGAALQTEDGESTMILDHGGVAISGSLIVGNGLTYSFTTLTGQTVSFVGGILVGVS